MRGISAVQKTLRGEVGLGAAILESVRRMNAALSSRREQRQLGQLNREPARLTTEFARLPRRELLEHFRSRKSPKFLPGFIDLRTTAHLQRELFPEQTEVLIAEATRIAEQHRWPLLGFGEKCFGTNEIDWNRDPLSGFEWPLDYHGDLNLFRSDGSDARVLWELNRLSHLITLGRAYVATGDEKFTAEFLTQVRSWRAQNPVARGANWSCAMEVALRAMNLLAAFLLFLRSPHFTEDALAELLMMFEQHGAHIRRNLEFSHLATSNHYMCDVAGLLWLGITLPELADARAWREFGLHELLQEMDKQILPDGADSESSTGYHRLKLELLLYSFVLCRENGIEIDERYWEKLRAMAAYARAYLRPDGRAPLIGDSDSGQVLPIVSRAADDHAYVVSIADAALGTHPSGKLARTEELLWLFGEQGVRDYEALPVASLVKSSAFQDAGVYILRDGDLYLLFNASGCGLKGRGSHGHNDALSIEVSAYGTPFIVDPGSYVYTHNLPERHLFRSTTYHSTVQVDGIEQNITNEQMPFVIGDEAHPRVLGWETNSEFDLVTAEHDGYRRLDEPVTHRRSIHFDKRNRFWLVEDDFSGAGRHQLTTRFHFNHGLETVVAREMAIARDVNTGARLWVRSIELSQPPEREAQFTSCDYGEKHSSMAASWLVRTRVPQKLRWLLLPIRPDENEHERLATILSLLS